MKGRTITVTGGAFILMITLAVMITSAELSPATRLRVPSPEASSEQICVEKCAVSRQTVGTRPPRAMIAARATEDVIESMTTGSMRQLPADLTRNDSRWRSSSPASSNLRRGKLSAIHARARLVNQTKWPAMEWLGSRSRELRFQPQPGIKAEMFRIEGQIGLDASG